MAARGADADPPAATDRLSGAGFGPSRSTDAFQDGLRALGYVEGRTILIDFRYCSGDVDQLRAQAAGLIKSGVELIVAPDTVSAITAGQATSTIPIVFAVAAAPLATGLVSNLARTAKRESDRPY